MGGGRVQLYAVGVAKANYIAGIFHDGQLHAKAQAQERLIVGSGVLDSDNFPLDAPGAEAAGHKNPVAVSQKLLSVFLGDSL